MVSLVEMSQARRRRIEASFDAAQASAIRLASPRALLLATGFVGVSVIVAVFLPPIARVIAAMVVAAALLVWGLAAAKRTRLAAQQLYDLLLAPSEPEPDPNSPPYPVWLSSPGDAKNFDELDRVLRLRGDDLRGAQERLRSSTAAQVRTMSLTAAVMLVSLAALIIVATRLVPGLLNSPPTATDSAVVLRESLGWLAFPFAALVAASIGVLQTKQLVLVARSAQSEAFRCGQDRMPQLAETDPGYGGGLVVKRGEGGFTLDAAAMQPRPSHAPNRAVASSALLIAAAAAAQLMGIGALITFAQG